uniref:Uncharacterized protein n=2 Tax=Nymphaea colorata TaxID=210225 RepID=A0A5K0ZJT6_9MAGN
MGITWVISSAIMVINFYYLITGFTKLLLHDGLRTVASVFLGVMGFSGMLVYLAGVLYLVFRKDKKVTYLLPVEDGISDAQSEMNRSIYLLPREDIVSMQLPPRRSTSDLD